MISYDLTVIIVSWNTCDLLRDCLRSVFHNSCELRLQVVVVDNASTDGSAAMLRDEFPEVRVVENSSNVGFARANNQVIPDCSANLVLLLNPDTVVVGSALRDLVEFMRESHDAGAVGPKLVHPREGLRVLGCGNQPTLWRVFTHYSFLSSLFPNCKPLEGIHLFVGVHDRATREVEWVSAACLLVRRTALTSAGGFCEDWFMYAEDWDLCARLRRNGLKIYHVPSAVVEHHLSASTEQNPTVSMMPVTATRAYFIKLNNPSRIELFLFDAVRSAGLALRAVGYFLRGINQDNVNREMWLKRSRMFRDFAIAALPWRCDQRTTHPLSKA